MNKQSTTRTYRPNQDLFRVATGTPDVSIADVATNVARIRELYLSAVKQNVSLVVFPELCITGYSLQDLVQQASLLADAVSGLLEIARLTVGNNTAIVVGFPMTVGNGIYNCAAVLAKGIICGIVPKQHLPTYNEFYEKRWYQAWDGRENITVKVGEQDVVFGKNQLFDICGQLVGVEICEDLWVPENPAINLVKNGATIIVNPSASTETVTKTSYRRDLVKITAAKLAVGYIYVSANETESTAETVMSGHAMINELGTMLAERIPFSTPQPLMIADIDTQHIIHDRQKTTNFPNEFNMQPFPTGVISDQADLLRIIDQSPFVPKGNPETITERLDEILNIQAMGLAMRLRNTCIRKVVLGLSGGLDSTLALLVAIRSAKILGYNAGELIHTLTMPGSASSDRTQNNAVNLARHLGITNEEIPISKLSQDQLIALKHTGDQDITYENTQARIRQALVFNKGNQIGGLVIGTGDLSEIALGWCSYNGDHMSHYNVNASIPKSLVRSLVLDASKQLDKKSRSILLDIVDTPISPELTGNSKDISQETEDIVGPYELHDFFLYHFLRWKEPVEKIEYFANVAFVGKYSDKEIHEWLSLFIKRFYGNQWKRQAMPDGAKVGISLSPKGDWRMPPEAKMVDMLN